MQNQFHTDGQIDAGLEVRVGCKRRFVELRGKISKLEVEIEVLILVVVESNIALAATKRAFLIDDG